MGGAIELTLRTNANFPARCQGFKAVLRSRSISAPWVFLTCESRRMQGRADTSDGDQMDEIAEVFRYRICVTQPIVMMRSGIYVIRRSVKCRWKKA